MILFKKNIKYNVVYIYSSIKIENEPKPNNRKKGKRTKMKRESDNYYYRTEYIDMQWPLCIVYLTKYVSPHFFFLFVSRRQSSALTFL